MVNQLPDITIRSEASLDFFAEGFTNNGFDVERKLIPVDGIIWTDSEPIAFERKSCSDFVRSIKDGSIWDQLKAMREFTSKDNAYLLLEDYDWYFSLKHTQFNRHAIVSTAHATTKFAHLITTLSKIHTYEWIQDRLEETLRQYKEIKYYPLRPAASKTLSPEKQAEYVVEGFPGVGGAASEKIRQNSDSFIHFIETVNYKPDTITYIKKPLVDKIKEICINPWRISK